ncbi:MAG TPA: acylase [Rhizomicrobium sp.]|jgi:penicillin amidase/acyl-homoserine-lactone acylase
MRFWKWTGVVLAGLIVVVLAGAATVIELDRMAQPAPPDPATLLAKAARYQVRIKRDTWGVPHVIGKTDADVGFGLGFAQSEDDFATLQEVTLASRGTLAASNGIGAATTDYLVHLFRVWENVNARYTKDIPPDVRRVVEAYADGANTYAALHPEKVLPGTLPFTGKDIVAGFVFKTPFFYGLDDVLKDLTSPKPTDTSSKTGSNGLAIAPSRSADGATRLLVNSHQPYAGPVSWYEVVLESGEGWHVAGGVFPGSPFMLHGHNEHLGWADTVNDPDLADVYKLTINPANENQYRLDGRWVDFEKSDAALRVKLWGPLIWTVHRDVLWSKHGPVLKTDRGVFAIRYAGMNEIRQVIQYYRLNKARDLDEWKAAMRLGYLPSINYVYADEKGNIGYVYNGEFPVRKPGVDWQGQLPGDRSDLIWHAYLPFDKLLQVWNPKSGIVFNSNNTPFQSAAPEDDPKPSDYPAWMGIQTNMTNRAYRAEETFGADTAITAAKFHDYKFDLAYSPRSEIAQEIAEVTQIDPKGDADLKRAQEILRNWNRETDIHNRGAALAIGMGLEISQKKHAGTPIAPLNALKDSIDNLKSHFGRLDPEWGQMNRMRRGSLDLPIDGGPDVYRAVYGEPQPDGTLTAVDGDTFIMFVTWDKNGKLSSQSIHQFGSATLDRNSKHYADQTPLFVKMQLKPVWFTDGELKGHVEADYKPGDRHD